MAVQTPMQRQYFEIKEQCRENVLLFFRLGDFYELFYEDAEIASKELGLTLTARHKKDKDKKMPMCGVPYHAAEKYIARLTKKGFSIAICEQVSDASLPGIVKREIVQIVTPGTTLNDEVLEQRSNNYLAGISFDQNEYGFAYADLSTGECKVTAIKTEELLFDELYRLQPTELLLTPQLFENKLFTQKLREQHRVVTRQTLPAEQKKFLCTFFGTKNLRSFDIEKEDGLIKVAALLVSYLDETQKQTLKHITSIQRYFSQELMYLDPASIRNLEVFATLQDNERQGSLLGVIDQSFTAMGGRLLRKIILAPLLSKKSIEKRLEMVETFTKSQKCLDSCQKLKQVMDIERILGRISCSRSHPQDLIGLKNSLSAASEIGSELADEKSLKSLQRELCQKDTQKVVKLIDESINEEAPTILQHGNVIREGYSKELDEIRKIDQGGKEWLKSFEEKQKKETGINTLKVRYNKVFGFYIEISKAQADKAPANYVRKQTLTNAERFITPELKSYEDKVLEAEEKLQGLEAQLFQEICQKILESAKTIQKLALSIAELDVFSSFARLALQQNFVRPEITENGEIYIKQGRHPVIEQLLPKGERFVPNDTHLSPDNASFLLLTGPNMSGKSTYLRQTAIITLMAQIGSFVPAEYAKISVVDRIFTRIGASDNLSQGQSTFMVEMQEAAYILHHATEKSLIILDEIGRGTATYDGLSLAWSIFEHIHDKLKTKTLFATHYHELIDVAEKKKQAKNLSVSVIEKDDKVIFLHSVVDGGADRSYGIEVAKLAGMPKAVVTRAEKILQSLEQGNGKKKITSENNPFQESLPLIQEVTKYENHPVLEQLEKLDIENTTAMEALHKLHELKQNTQQHS